MTFKSPDQWGNCQAAHIAPLVVPYLQGRSLDIGSGRGTVWPRCIGIDIADDGGRPITDLKMDATDLSMFADGSVDAVFSSFLLHQMERAKAVLAVREWTRVLKVGGYMVLYAPNCAGDHLGADGKRVNVAPKRGDEGADPNQKWDIRKGDLNCLLDIETKVGWDLILDEYRDGGDEFGILVIARKRADEEWTEDFYWHRHPDGRDRCLVIRYGAIGDAFVTASVLPLLKKQDYHVTVNTMPKIQDILRHDPNIDAWLIQETDFVPNHLLGAYWTALNERYDRIVNLSESVEGLLLTLPGRLNHAYSHAARDKVCGGINYLEHTHNIADVPFEFEGSRFYPTADEHTWAKAVRKRKNGSVVVWTVNGSSVHKVYPFVQIVAKWLLTRTPCHIVLYADPGVGKDLAKGILECLKEEADVDMSRIVSIADKWSIRQSLTFAQYADVIVGPETGPLNAMAMEQVPKVIYLSHSNEENLTKHWVNTTTLTPPLDKCPCYPCHRLHFTWEYCHKDEKTGAALCASSIKPEIVFKAIAKALGATVQK